ncbi:MAG: hypothetical protein PHD15_07565 [Clostridia bacterium]|nr:hypothetical protein [Clostridia bacterium]
MKNSFNIFRLNCLIGGEDSGNFNDIILSVIYGLLYENKNEEITLTESFVYINDILKISIDNDLFKKLISDSKHLVLTPIRDDVLIKLTCDKFKQIDENILNQSIEHYLADFVRKKNLEKDYEDKLFRLLSKAIYENINSFTIKNINSLVTQNISNGFSNKEIELFNEFLEDKNHLKNVAIYNTFVKAVEFAIITSGKGVREFTKDLFKGKEYFLDANIIFRLLGIGGEERQKSISTLIKQCVHQGILFYYSIATYKEIKRKIQSSIRDIKSANAKGALSIIENIATDECPNYHLNDGFITLYSRLRKDGTVKSPDQFELWLTTRFKVIEKDYFIQSKNCQSKLKETQIEYWSNKLFDLKEALNKNIHYTRTAARVDSINILYVKLIRGSNNYNYSDVKSFYLTTDRSLNLIIAKDTELIPETILPSQLFIIHNSLSDDVDNVDYNTFTMFLKRRTTEFKLSGQEILKYIEEIRIYSNDDEIIQEVIKAYSDLKYEKRDNDGISSNYLPTMDEFAKTYIDRRLLTAELGEQKYKSILLNAISQLNKYIKLSRTITKIIDMIIMIVIIPALGLLAKTFISDILIIALIIILFEFIKFVLSSKFNFLFKIMAYIFHLLVKFSSYSKVMDNANVISEKAEELLQEQNRNIWQK